MFLTRITPFTYHNIDTVNLGRIKCSSFYFGSSLSCYLPSEMSKQANMANPLLSNKHLLKMNEPLLRMYTETVNVGWIKPRDLYFSLGLSCFVRSGKDQQANMANPLLANTCLLEMNEPFLRMDEHLLRKMETLLRVTKPLLRKTKHFGRGSLGTDILPTAWIQPRHIAASSGNLWKRILESFFLFLAWIIHSEAMQCGILLRIYESMGTEQPS